MSSGSRFGSAYARTSRGYSSQSAAYDRYKQDDDPSRRCKESPERDEGWRVSDRLYELSQRNRAKFDL